MYIKPPGSFTVRTCYFSEILDNLKKQGYSRQLTMDILRCRIIDLLYEWNRLEEAQHLALQNLTQENATQLPYITVDIYNQRARSYLLEGNFASAQKELDKADALTRQAYIWPGLTWQTRDTSGNALVEDRRYPVCKNLG